MRRAIGAGLVLVALVAMTGTAGAVKKPPAADLNAQTACQVMHLVDVNRTYGVDASDTETSNIIQALQQSRSQGAAKLAKQLFNAPTTAAQTAARSAVDHWCFQTLKIRCSVDTCVGGNQVTTIPKKK
jgi:hypothetical protein